MIKALHRHEHKIKKKGQKYFQKDLFRLKNNFVFVKTIENLKNHRDIKQLNKEETSLCQSLATIQ